MIGNVSEDTNGCIPRIEDTGLSPKKIKMMVKKKKTVWVFYVVFVFYLRSISALGCSLCS